MNGDNFPTGSQSGKNPEPINPSPTQPATADQLQNAQKEMTGFERATLRWAKLAFFAAAVAAIFIGFQWHEMRSGSKDTHDLAVAAKTQADSTKAVAEHALAQVEATDKLHQEFKRTADIADNALKINTMQSQAALKQGIAISRLEQRAWVSVPSIPNTKPQIGQILNIPIRVKNTGKTPAKKLTVYAGILVVKKGDKLIFPYKDDVSFKDISEYIDDISDPKISRGIIAPNDERCTEVTIEYIKEDKSTNGKFTKEGIDLIKSVAETYYIHGKIFYNDIYEGAHWTTFCYEYNPVDGYSTVCEEHNNMDK